MLLKSRCMEHDFYQTLDVTPHASAKAIKQAYYKQAKHFHPDRNQSDDAAEQFIQVKKAYEVLSNPVLRKRYDFEQRQARRQFHSNGKRASYHNQNWSSGDFEAAGYPFEFDTPGVSHQNRPILYNCFFAFGIVAGIMLVGLSIKLFYITEGIQKLACIFVFPGLIFIHDGWMGLSWNQERPFWIRISKKMRSFFRINFDLDA